MALSTISEHKKYHTCIYTGCTKGQTQSHETNKMAVLLLWIFDVSSVLRLLCLCTCLIICALWSPAGKRLTSWLSFVVSNCEFVTFLFILGQVWYLIVSIPDLCTLTYFVTITCGILDQVCHLNVSIPDLC